MRKIITDEDLLHLRRFITPSWRVMSTYLDRKENKSYAKFTGYIDARDVNDTLDDVVGPSNWQIEYYDVKDKKYIVAARIGIRVYDEWIWKSDCGEADDKNSATSYDKTLLSDAKKRAAVNWGIGAFLYKLKDGKPIKLRYTEEKIEGKKDDKFDKQYYDDNDNEIKYYKLNDYLNSSKVVTEKFNACKAEFNKLISVKAMTELEEEYAVSLIMKAQSKDDLKNIRAKFANVRSDKYQETFNKALAVFNK